MMIFLMAYLLGVNIPNNKPVHIALKKVYGIGYTTAKIICHRLHLNPQYKVFQLTDLQNNLLMKEIKYFLTHTELKKKIKAHVDQLIQMRSYRGIRHVLGLPVRGQRTRSNARTQRSLFKKRLTNQTKTVDKKVLKKSNSQKKNISTKKKK